MDEADQVMLWLGDLLAGGTYSVLSGPGWALPMESCWDWLQGSLRDEVFHAWWCGLFGGYMRGRLVIPSWSDVQGILRRMSVGAVVC